MHISFENKHITNIYNIKFLGLIILCLGKAILINQFLNWIKYVMQLGQLNH